MGIEAGQAAPEFALDSTTGRTISLKDLRGKKVVLYFYPKDDTPGCTREACNFRDAFADFEKSNAVILGVSPDDVSSHHDFKKKFNLPFPLLADPDHKIADAYGVWKEKTNYGKSYMGIERTTFVIDTHGQVATVFPKVKVDEHQVEVLKAVEAAG
ncbi:MAG TPA: thioredoxin-dependent thiol peroxidase [Phycisphaerae bacterium]|nr:thioredoxin-dependent thiol peroxidase [Phycisphaerae bacterium]